MELLTEKVSETITEGFKSLDNNKLHVVVELIAELKKAGLIKQPKYNLPLVDTIGRKYYPSINKHK